MNVFRKIAGLRKTSSADPAAFPESPPPPAPPAQRVARRRTSSRQFTAADQVLRRADQVGGGAADQVMRRVRTSMLNANAGMAVTPNAGTSCTPLVRRWGAGEVEVPLHHADLHHGKPHEDRSSSRRDSGRSSGSSKTRAQRQGASSRCTGPAKSPEESAEQHHEQYFENLLASRQCVDAALSASCYALEHNEDFGAEQDSNNRSNNRSVRSNNRSDQQLFGSRGQPSSRSAAISTRVARPPPAETTLAAKVVVSAGGGRAVLGGRRDVTSHAAEAWELNRASPTLRAAANKDYLASSVVALPDALALTAECIEDQGIDTPPLVAPSSRRSVEPRPRPPSIVSVVPRLELPLGMTSSSMGGLLAGGKFLFSPEHTESEGRKDQSVRSDLASLSREELLTRATQLEAENEAFKEQMRASGLEPVSPVFSVGPVSGGRVPAGAAGAGAIGGDDLFPPPPTIEAPPAPPAFQQPGSAANEDLFPPPGVGYNDDPFPPPGVGYNNDPFPPPGVGYKNDDPFPPPGVGYKNDDPFPPPGVGYDDPLPPPEGGSHRDDPFYPPNRTSQSEKVPSRPTSAASSAAAGSSLDFGLHDELSGLSHEDLVKRTEELAWEKKRLFKQLRDSGVKATEA